MRNTGLTPRCGVVW